MVDWIANVLVLIGLVVGLVRWRADREGQKEALAASLSAEIEALRELIDSRNFLEEMRKAVADDDPPYRIPLRDRDVLPIYSANLASGLLGSELCRDLARHFTLVQSFLDQNAEYEKAPTREEWRASSEAHLSLAEKIVALQPRLVSRLNEKARPWSERMLS